LIMETRTADDGMLPVEPPSYIKERALFMHRDPHAVAVRSWNKKNPNGLLDPLEPWIREKRYNGLINWQDKFESLERDIETQVGLTTEVAGKVRHVDNAYGWVTKHNWLQPPYKKKPKQVGWLRISRTDPAEHTNGSLVDLEIPMQARTVKLAKSLSLGRLVPTGNGPEFTEQGVPSETFVSTLKLLQKSISSPALLHH